MKKRILGIMLALCMILMICPVTAFAQGDGDINGDGSISMDDVELLQEYLNNGTILDEYELNAADFNGDNVVDNNDLIAIQLRIFEIEGKEPTIEIKLDGFDVGRTKTDITLSATSDILGLTFDTTLINCFDDGYYGEITSQHRFKIDTTYALDIKLVTKQITLPMHFTINGTPVGVEKSRTENGETTYSFRYSATPDVKPIIDGPDAVHPYQDYEFTVTLPVSDMSILEYPNFEYERYFFRPDWLEHDLYILTTDDDGVRHGVIPGIRFVENENINFDRRDYFFDIEVRAVYNETTKTSIKTIQVLPDHVFDENGVCPCREVLELSLTVPFTTNVVVDDDGKPGETVFNLETIGNDNADATFSGSVITDGEGEYYGTLTITGTKEQLVDILYYSGAFVRQTDEGLDGWTIEDTVYGLMLDDAETKTINGVEFPYELKIVKPSVDGDGNYTINWNNPEYLDEMTFTNTYSVHISDTTTTTTPIRVIPDTGVMTDTNSGNTHILNMTLLLIAAADITGTVYNKKKNK